MLNKRIIFMGTPNISLIYLEYLIKNKLNIVAVYSQPPKKKGRGMKIQQSPVHQLALLNNIKVRQENFNKQNTFFKNHSKYFSTPNQTSNSESAWLAYPILINKDANFSRREFQIFLENRNIQTRVVFTGNIIRQPMMKNLNYKTNNIGYPNSDSVMERGVLLPLHHGMTDEMFKRLHDTINEFINSKI